MRWMVALATAGLIFGARVTLAASGGGGGGSGGGIGGGPGMPTPGATPMGGPGSPVSRDATKVMALANQHPQRAPHIPTEAELAAAQIAKEKWVTWFQASQPGFLMMGAARELPLGFRIAGSAGVVLVAPSFEGELQLPAARFGGVRLYAAGAAQYQYVPRVTITGPSARAWGYGPKLGVEWRLPMREGAAHGWHLGADAGVLFGDWSSIYGSGAKKQLLAFTPLRVGYYW